MKKERRRKKRITISTVLGSSRRRTYTHPHIHREYRKQNEKDKNFHM
jgi:hypothetical protein